MMERRMVLAVGALLSLLPTADLPGQVPAAIDYPSDASSAAMGSANVAEWGSLGATAVNPAVAGTLGRFSLESGISSSRGADEAGFALRGGVPLGAVSLAIEYQHKSVSDLIEDPAIDESGLGVSDSQLRVGVGRRLGTGVAVGGAAGITWSDVFDTNGNGHFFAFGAIARPLPTLTLGASIRRLGGRFEWAAPGGVETSADVPVGYRFGASFTGLRVDEVVVGLAADVETGSGLSGTEAALGVEAEYRSLFVVRAGLHSPPAVDPYWTTGLGLRMDGIEAALSYELIDIVGPRLQFQVRVTPSTL